MRPASGIFQKRQHTLSARVLGCTKNGGFWKTALSPSEGNRYSHLYPTPLHSVSTTTRIGE
jgi:hypothetical protein